MGLLGGEDTTSGHQKQGSTHCPRKRRIESSDGRTVRRSSRHHLQDQVPQGTRLLQLRRFFRAFPRSS